MEEVIWKVPPPVPSFMRSAIASALSIVEEMREKERNKKIIELEVEK